MHYIFVWLKNEIKLIVMGFCNRWVFSDVFTQSYDIFSRCCKCVRTKPRSCGVLATYLFMSMLGSDSFWATAVYLYSRLCNHTVILQSGREIDVAHASCAVSVTTRVVAWSTNRWFTTHKDHVFHIISRPGSRRVSRRWWLMTESVCYIVIQRLAR